MKLKIAIIDDEIHAIETLRYDLMENFGEQIEILFTSTDPIEGLKQIREQAPDLLFLDIEMPTLSGMDLLKLISDLHIQVVITTAFQEFAIEAVGTKAIAYLLKPIQPEMLEKVMNRVLKNKQAQPRNSMLRDKIAVADLEGVELIPHDEIIYCKSDGNYSTLFLAENRKLMVSKALKYFSNNLPANQFVRIHKSYLVNLKYVKKYLKVGGGELVMTNNDVLPVSRIYRTELLKLLQNGS
jgi:two-component system LytT family response regulator